MPEGEDLTAFVATGATLAIHLAIHRIGEIADHVRPPYGADCPVAVVARASWPDEQVVRAPLGEIAWARR